MTYLIAVLCIVLGNYFDYASTVHAINHGAREANPLVRALGLLPAKLLAATLQSLLVLITYYLHRPHNSLMIGLITLMFYSFVALWNLHVGGKF